MLVAGAAASMIAPFAAQATDINLEDMNSYSNSSKSAGFTNNYLNVQPGDWAHQSIKDLVNSRGCNVNVSDKSLTRFEAAAIVNSCLGDVAEVSNRERRLIDEFSSEITLLRGRVDGIEARANKFEAGVFSPTTSASFSADFAIGGVDGAATDKVSLDYGYQIDLTTSFTGDDSFDVSIDAGQGTLGELDLNSGGDGLVVDGIAYTFPLGDKTNVFIGNNMDGSTLFNTACVYGLSLIHI